MSGVESTFRKDVDRITDADILRLASSADVDEAAFGRMLATGVAQMVQAFIDGEVQRTTPPAAITNAIVNLAASSIASIITHRAIDRPGAARLEIERFGAYLLHSLGARGTPEHGGAQ